MEDNRNSGAYVGGISFTTILFFIFLVLKLCHVIDWSWWWVTAPLWAPGVLIAVIFVIWLAIYLIIEQIKDKKHKK